MRNRTPHAAGGGSLPSGLLGSKYTRAALAASVGLGLGLVPAIAVSSPALAVTTTSDFTLSATNMSVTEGGSFALTVANSGGIASGTYTVAVLPDTVGAHSADVNQNDATKDVGAPTPATFTATSTMTPLSVTLPTISDSTYEYNETFDVVIQDASTGAASNTLTLTINDDDTAPTYTLSASPSPVSESASTTTITANLSAASGVPTSIALTSTDGTAVAGTNYAAVSGSISIAAGQTSGTAPVTIMNDHMHDATSPMTFTVNGLGDNVTGKSQTVQVGITDVQPMPKVSITSNGAAAEGSNGTFTISTDTKSAQPITVNWDVVNTPTPANGDGVATAGTDFTYPPSPRTITIPAGAMSTTLSIPYTQDNLSELQEDYTVAISSPVNAVLGDPVKAVGIITDADTSPRLTVTPTSVTEGDSGSKWQSFTATLSAKSGRTVTANWNTFDLDGIHYPSANPATAGLDYAAANGTLVFPAGTTTQTFSVQIIGDKVYENPSEQFGVRFSVPNSDPTPAAFMADPALITITDDDPMPSLTVADTAVKEGNSPWAYLLPIKLSNPAGKNITVTLNDTPLLTTSSALTTTPGSNDYNLLTPSVTIPAGQSTGYAVIMINGDTMYEPDESTSIAWSTVSDQVTMSTRSGTEKFTLLNDDKAPDLEINSTHGKPGDTVAVTGTVTGTSQDDATLTIWFQPAAMNGKKAADPADFTNPGVVQVVLPAGTPVGTTLDVTKLVLTASTAVKPDETIKVSGSSVGNAATVTDGVVQIDGTANAETPTISAPVNLNGAGNVTISGKAAAGATVSLWGTPWTADKTAELKWIADTKASSTGMYSFTRMIATGWRFAVKASDQTTAEKWVSVTQWPTLTAVSPSKGMVSLTAWGNPKGAGQTVTIQRWWNGAYVTLWTGKTGADGMWKASVKEPSGSNWALRAVIAGMPDNGLKTGYSTPKYVTIK